MYIKISKFVLQMENTIDKLMAFFLRKPVVMSSISAVHSLLSILTWNIPQRENRMSY